MKKFFTGKLSVAALAWFLLLTSACNDDDNKPENPQEFIKKTWHIGATGYVKKDGSALTSEYANLRVTLKSDGTYSTINGKKLFFPSGIWNWVGTGTGQFLVDGDLSVTVTELTKTSLKIKFTMDEDHVNTSGRTQAVLGNYEVALEAE
ncbi:MAG TPA: hypothetical protein VGD40_06920 [Chryseosolibacter sp.]